MLPRQRLQVPFLLLFLAFAILAGRLYIIQVWKHHELDTLTDRQVERTSKRMPLRGMILDRKGQILSLSLELHSCFADPKKLKNPAAAAKALAPLLETSARELEKKIRHTKGSFVWLKRKLDPEVADKIQELDLAGIGLMREEKRTNPHDGLAAHLIGTVGEDNQGLSGVEYTYDRALRGGQIRETWERDAKGRGVLKQRTLSVAPRNVVLTIDKTIQYIAEQEIEKAVKEFSAHSGTVVIQDVHTGEILAMAYRSGQGDPASATHADLVKNPAISNIFEPGSTYKIVVAAAALEENLVTPQETFHCEDGSYKVADRVIHDHEKHGLLTFAQVMEHSSNIGMAKVGLRVGKDRLYTYSRAFGFGALSGISVDGEATGILRSPARWSGTSLSMISFGQEVGVTALQLVNAYSAIANGGWLLEPQIVSKLVDSDGREEAVAETSVVRKVISQKTVFELTRMLEQVVTSGTGVSAQIRGYRVAGKTGTAQKIDPVTKRYSATQYTASFCGYLPADRPRATIVVILDEPRGVYWGGYCAAPVFSRIGLRLMHALNIPPNDQIQPTLVKAAPIKG